MRNPIRFIFNRFIAYFFRGLLFIAPLGITVLILFSAFDFVDSLGRIQFESWTDPNKKIFIPGLGFLIVVGGTAFIGVLFTKILPITIQGWLEEKLSNLPLVKIFYTATKDLISAFLGEKKKFTTGVLVTINYHPVVKKMGFLTQENLDVFNLPDMVSVYCPHGYAISGQTFIVSKKDVEILDIPSTELMKMAISGGVSITETK
ncbi:DUF502 domain-containing protein [Leadbetterella byssophila]|jgi:uncharacterized membrane protein|uniref:DUF502 domain-containing protein n=1 Tax=Leadbetterella byssophila (strain DSM 17132 / JCM 16389 / KACC 11308 / NBRC 106382 / 4M15) TaxID=649349 RepID=E4RY66_LEAB4|nr:DUF502 domain-containing protein [Leadbetterella byssophila]ADQ17277.1 protein of unknown function DUF502 [Leadbetterella byssophila DSM 17132]